MNVDGVATTGIVVVLVLVLVVLAIENPDDFGVEMLKL